MTSRNAPRFFVTGGTGFIGSRLIEVLREEIGAQVTALAHRTSAGALRLAAAGVPLDFTPITDVAGLTKAIDGHDAVFHLAFGKSGSAADIRRTTIDGTSALVEAALAARVPRFVNVSTAAVYFGAPDGTCDETAPRRKWGWDYSDEKLAAEDVVRAATAGRGLEGSIFQVAGVYGPWGETFVSAPLSNMRRGMVVLPNHGRGIANLTYVDDVVQALVLGLQDAAVGETFIVKGPGRITRREAYGWLEEMLGYEAVEVRTTEDVRRAVRGGASWRGLARVARAALGALRRSPELKEAVRETPLLPLARPVYRMLKGRGGPSAHRSAAARAAADLPRVLPPAIMVDYLSAEVSFSSAKAERVLGYQPFVNLEEGMGATREWARWAGLLGPRRAA